jgi:hypothetical protein
VTAPILLILVVLAAVLAGILAAAGGLYLLGRRYTSLTWHGRDLLLVQAPLHRELRVDGRIVAWAGPGSERLVGTLQDPVHGVVPLVWSVAGQSFGLYAAGQRLAGALEDEVARAESEGQVWEPADARWPPAKAILESLAASRDGATQEATMRIRTGLHDALRHLAVLTETASAHAALGGDAELASARAALDHEIERWLAALRALHLQATVKAGSADDILAKVRAESEVDGVVRQKARELAHRLGLRQQG